MAVPCAVDLQLSNLNSLVPRERQKKNFPAWPAARHFMLIISDFPIPLPSFLSEVENWIPQGCHIISEIGLIVISPISPTPLTEWFLFLFVCLFVVVVVVVVVLFSKNTKIE